MNEQEQALLRRLLSVHPCTGAECTVTKHGFIDGDDGRFYPGWLVVDTGRITANKYFLMGATDGIEYRFIIDGRYKRAHVQAV